MNKGNTDQIRSVQVQSSRKWIMTTAIVLATLMLGSLIFLAVSGRIAVAFGANRQAIVRTVVCGDEIVERYQEIYFPLDEDDSQTVDELIATITSNPYSSDDPTCQTILFWLADGRKDVQTKESSLAAIKRLHKEGAYANSALRDGALNYLEAAMTWTDGDGLIDEQ